MAKSSIAEAYIQLRLSLDGMTQEIRQQLGPVADLASNMLADGFRQAAQQGGANIAQELNAVATAARSDFSNIMDGVQINSSQLSAQFNAVANSAQTSLTQAFNQSADALNNQMNQVANNTQNQMSQAFQNSTSVLNSQMSHASTTIETQLSHAFQSSMAILQSQMTQTANQMQAQMHQSMTQALQNLPAPQVPTQPLQQSTQQAVQQGSQQGITGGFAAAGPAIVGIIAGLGIGAAIGKAIGSGVELEDSKAKLQASLMAFDPALAKMAGEAAGKLYADGYGESMEEVNGTTQAVLSSFKELKNGSSAQIEELTKRALNLGQIADVDADRLSQVASQLVTQGFAKDGVEAMDQLGAAMSRVPKALQADIVDALDEYAPFMKSIGKGGEQGISMLVKSAEKGMYGIDKFGDSLKETTLRIGNIDDKAAQEALTNMGLNSVQISRDIVSGGEAGSKAFDSVVAGLKGIQDPAKQAAEAVKIFGTPIEDLSLSEIPAFLDTLGGIPGGLGDISAAAIEMDKILGGTAANAFEKMKRSASMAFGEAMIPVIAELKPIIDEITVWLKDNQSEIAEWVAVFADGIRSVVVPAAQFLMPILKDIFGWLSENKELVATLIPIIATLAAGFIAFQAITGLIAIGHAIAGAFAAATLATAGFGISLIPLIAICAAVLAIGYAIGTLIYGLWTDFDGTTAAIGNFFKTIGDGLWEFFHGMGAVGDAIMSIAGHMFNGLIHAINFVIQGIAGLLSLIPGTDPMAVKTIPLIDNLPALATGAEITGPTVALIGEEDPEYVVNRGVMNDMMTAVTSQLLNGNGGGSGETIQYITVEVIHNGNESPEELGDKIAIALDYKQRR